jgi:hypothetical protein
MIFLYILFGTSILVQSIPQNLDIDVVKVVLTKEGSKFPRFTQLMGVVPGQFLNFKMKRVVMPVFEHIKQIAQPSKTSEVLFNKITSNWEANPKGRILPPWNPREFDKTHMDLLNTSQIQAIETNSKIFYSGEIRLGDPENKLNVQFSLNDDHNIILSSDCNSCSSQKGYPTYDCSTSASCSIDQTSVSV